MLLFSMTEAVHNEITFWLVLVGALAVAKCVWDMRR